jgi:3-hydroxyisobutyrate dehydrogenase-like beta-hydroxyacid dehydrogenase
VTSATPATAATAATAARAATAATSARSGGAIALAGFGEVGQAFARALVAHAVPVRVFHPRPRAPACAAAAALGLVIDTEPQAAFRDAALVLSVVPGQQALETARAAARVLSGDAVFADLTSAAPAIMREAAALFPALGYTDGAIMGAVSIHAHATRILCSGAAAQRLAAMLGPFGFQIDCVAGGQPGDASGLKLLRSIFTKGMDAVVIECLLAAEAVGLRRQLLQEMGDLDRSTVSELMTMFVRTHAPHAWRRMHEVASIQHTLGDAGLTLPVTAAVHERYARTVRLLGRSPEIPAPGAGQSVMDTVLPWMLTAEREGVS